MSLGFKIKKEMEKEEGDRIKDNGEKTPPPQYSCKDVYC